MPRRSQAVDAAVSGSAALGVQFPNTDIGTRFAQVAKIIQVRQSLGATRQIFFCSPGGYDTHAGQLATQVLLYGNLAASMAAFDQTMGQLGVLNNVTTFTESDFGRTFQPNGNAGSDHGRGQPRAGHGWRRGRRPDSRAVPDSSARRPRRWHSRLVHDFSPR